MLALRLPVRRLRQLLKIRTGCQNLPGDVGRRKGVERHARVCTACDSGQVGDEQHLVFESADLQPLREHLSHLSKRPLTVQQFMWQPYLAGVALFISEGLAVLQQE